MIFRKSLPPRWIQFLRNVFNAEAVIEQCYSISSPRVTLRSPWAVWLLPPFQGLFSGKSELVRTLSFSSMNSWVLQIENLSTAGNFKLKENLILWHKPSKRQTSENIKLKQDLILWNKPSKRQKNGRGDWIRTSDLYVPNVALQPDWATPRLWVSNQNDNVIYIRIGKNANQKSIKNHW